jgi:hypothetical protein
VIRSALLVTVLTGCTFYVSGSGVSGDAAGSGSDADLPPPDSQLTVDTPDDTISPPLGDAAIDSFLPPFDVNIPPFDVNVPPFDAFVPPDIVITPPDATNTSPLETLTIPCTGQVVVSQLTYSSAQNYRVRASGLCKVDEFLGNDIFVDAEYVLATFPRNREGAVDVGLGLYDTTLGFDKAPDWGSYNASHVYEITGPGFDVPVTVRFHDKANNAYGNNSGSLTLEIFAN